MKKADRRKGEDIAFLGALGGILDNRGKKWGTGRKKRGKNQDLPLGGA